MSQLLGLSCFHLALTSEAPSCHRGNEEQDVGVSGGGGSEEGVELTSRKEEGFVALSMSTVLFLVWMPHLCSWKGVLGVGLRRRSGGLLAFPSACRSGLGDLERTTWVSGTMLETPRPEAMAVTQNNGHRNGYEEARRERRSPPSRSGGRALL